MKVSAAEGRILDLLWRQGPSDAGQILSELGPVEGWSDPTVRTLLRRLIAKKAVVRKKDGNRPIYHPLIAREAVAGAESATLIDRFYDGRIGPLVLQFSRTRKLSAEDIDDLKRLIERLDDDDQ